MGVLQDIKEQYPTLAWLVNDPEVGKLLKDAVNPNKGFSAASFQAKLYNTQWWKKRSTSQRQFEILQHTDPAEWRRQIDAASAGVRAMAARLGLKLSPQQMRYIGLVNYRNGVDVNSPEFALNLRGIAGYGSTTFGAGSVATAQVQVRDMAHNQYYFPINDRDARRWALDIAFGLKTEDDFKARMSERAASLYPHLKELLQNGASMEDIFSGHRAVIAKELELSPVEIDFTDAAWKKVLYQVDPATGKPRPMTLHEAQTLARQDKRWWNTAGGRQQDAGMANFMLKTFGARA